MSLTIKLFHLLSKQGTIIINYIQVYEMQNFFENFIFHLITFLFSNTVSWKLSKMYRTLFCISGKIVKVILVVYGSKSQNLCYLYLHNTHTNTNTNTNTRTNTHILIHTMTHTDTHTNTHKRRHIHDYTHTYT